MARVISPQGQEAVKILRISPAWPVFLAFLAERTEKASNRVFTTPAGGETERNVGRAESLRFLLDDLKGVI
jgi:hypothetical protein